MIGRTTGIGAALLRKEDKRFLTGKRQLRGRHQAAGHGRGVFVRSPHAHAVFSIDTAAALAMPGVVAVLTGADSRPTAWAGCPAAGVTGNDGMPMKEPRTRRWRRARCAASAMRSFSSSPRRWSRRAMREDVEVEYDVLPAVVGVLDAIKPGAPLVFDDIPDNMCCRLGAAATAATDAAFQKAAHVARISLVNNRLVGNPMEPRAAIGEYDPAPEQYTLWTTSQFPHIVKLLMGNFVLDIPQHKLRVVAPDVGGGFRGQAVPLRRGGA